jgi:spoIIIJ-associated protein
MRERQIQRGKEWLEELLRLMGFPAPVAIGQMEERDLEHRSCWLIIDQTNLTPEQIERLVGEKGENIDAMQYMASAVLNIGAEQEDQMSFTIELNGYRRRRQEELFQEAQRVAQEVRNSGQEVEMPNLSSAERRQLHSFLKEFGDLETESRGLEPHRKLVVKLKS